MVRLRCIAPLLILILTLACGGSAAPGNSAADREAAKGAASALARGELESARDLSTTVLAKTPRNSLAAASRGLATWVLAGDALVTELGAVIEAAEPVGRFNHPQTRRSLEQALSTLMAVRADFAIAARDPTLSLRVCLACWKRDWNHSGEIDDRDARLLAIERDQSGHELADGDPRRKPTYHFDVGDAHWAHAMASFQAAALEIVLAYNGSELDKLLERMPTAIELPLIDKARVARARTLILEGLDSSDAARRAYLAETDDDIEWVPNPRQKNSPMPLPVDDALYATWEAVIGDVRDLVRGNTGISLGELSMLEPDLRGMTRPTGYLDVGRMLREPRSIRISVADIAQSIDAGEARGQVDADAILEKVFGVYYARSMKASPLTRRLLELRSALETGGDTLERKLMYLLWLN